VLASEILIVTPAIRALIRDNKAHQIMSTIQTSGAAGMRSMNQSLFDLYRAGAITHEDALESCHDEADFQRLMERPTSSSAPRRPISR
jgi:twitching motility protein PilT